MNNNEIKEILQYLKDDSKSFIICGVSYYKITDYKTKILLEYITNLQEENEYNNYCNEELRKKIINLEYKNERLQEENKRLKEILHWKQIENNIFYKSRIDKAIEEKKIPEKLKWVDYNTEFTHGELNKEFRNICNTIDEIIDFLKSKGEQIER